KSPHTAVTLTCPIGRQIKKAIFITGLVTNMASGHFLVGGCIILNKTVFTIPLFHSKYEPLMVSQVIMAIAVHCNWDVCKKAIAIAGQPLRHDDS
ncbi:MAG: hypothetical protein Q4G60_13925, partial [bacterium]|nr:hypothetical protein [bacterium]